MYQATKLPRIISQKPAPGWEVPKDYDWKELPATPANVALWKKIQEKGKQKYFYRGGEARNNQNSHSWLHVHGLLNCFFFVKYKCVWLKLHFFLLCVFLC